jgi:carbonic anhydrase
MTGNRKDWFIRAGVALTLGLGVLALWRGPWARQKPQQNGLTDPRAVLAEFKAGNARFVASKRTRSTDTRHDDGWRRRLAKGQHPAAVVLCCADSRICPEFIFDQRIGSSFEIRNAGNVVDEDVLASMEYAVEHLHTPVILVLGHKGCGAIEAVHSAGDQPLHDHLRVLQEHMAGLRDEVLREHGTHTAEFLNHLAEENARQQAVRLLQESPVIRAAVRHGQVAVEVGLYDMETGVVEFRHVDEVVGQSDD